MLLATGIIPVVPGLDPIALTGEIASSRGGPRGIRSLPRTTGITREIREGLGEARVPTLQLGRALHHWTHAPGYVAAVAAGQRRRHLDGTDAGEPDEAQRRHAREIIAQRAARRRTC